MYPAGYATSVDVGPLGRELEGEYRPDHFRGVATVVLKLFQIVPAEVAFFGRKDYQQSLVVRQMVGRLERADRDSRVPDGPRAGRPCHELAERVFERRRTAAGAGALAELAVGGAACGRRRARRGDDPRARCRSTFARSAASTCSTLRLSPTAP